MVKKKDKTLTTRFETQTMAEFSVAVELLGFRSINALVHQLVHQKIREAKNLTTAEEFAAMVERQKAETETRSETKSRERLEMLEAAPSPQVEFIGKLMPHSKRKMPLIEATVEAAGKKNKKTA